ncbi:hypothetical protein FQR65_LT20065 [Abscondita terminalis]|nr:hypothetical protein FQR65_LT20065 [Abscondita terminalis]
MPVVLPHAPAGVSTAFVGGNACTPGNDAPRSPGAARPVTGLVQHQHPRVIIIGLVRSFPSARPGGMPTIGHRLAGATWRPTGEFSPSDPPTNAAGEESCRPRRSRVPQPAPARAPESQPPVSRRHAQHGKPARRMPPGTLRKGDASRPSCAMTDCWITRPGGPTPSVLGGRLLRSPLGPATSHRTSNRDKLNYFIQIIKIQNLSNYYIRMSSPHTRRATTPANSRRMHLLGSTGARRSARAAAAVAASMSDIDLRHLHHGFEGAFRCCADRAASCKASVSSIEVIQDDSGRPDTPDPNAKQGHWHKAFRGRAPHGASVPLEGRNLGRHRTRPPPEFAGAPAKLRRSRRRTARTFNPPDEGAIPIGFRDCGEGWSEMNLASGPRWARALRLRVMRRTPWKRGAEPGWWSQAVCDHDPWNPDGVESDGGHQHGRGRACRPVLAAFKHWRPPCAVVLASNPRPNAVAAALPQANGARACPAHGRSHDGAEPEAPVPAIRDRDAVADSRSTRAPGVDQNCVWRWTRTRAQPRRAPMPDPTHGSTASPCPRTGHVKARAHQPSTTTSSWSNDASGEGGRECGHASNVVPVDARQMAGIDDNKTALIRTGRG